MKNINETQQRSVESLRAQVPDLEVRWSEEHGVASLLSGRLLPWEQVRDSEQLVRAVLDKYSGLVGPADIIEHYRVTGVEQDRKRGGYRARACQVVQGLPVYGATLLVFADEKRGIYRIQSSFWREVKITAEQRLYEGDLQRLLHERLRQDPAGANFEDSWRAQQPDAWSVEHFPLIGYPTLYLYPVGDGFHPAYNVLTFQPMEWRGIAGELRREIGQVDLLLDAATGEVIWSESTKEGMAYTDQTLDGLSTLQDSSGNYLSRPLHVVQKDSSNFFMLNRLHTPEIRTYDAGGTEMGSFVSKLKSDDDLSQDADGHWDTITTSCTADTRRDAQQPEVDGHFYAEEAWNFYHNLGWDGFDNGRYGTPCPIRVVAHIGMDANAYFYYYYEPVPNTTTNKYYGYIVFYDGLCDGTTLKFDFMAGDPVIFGHEYQHAITFFGAAKSNGEPGHLKILVNDWLGAIREGFSDAFGCLRRDLWVIPLFWRDGVLRSGSDFTIIPKNYPHPITVHCQPFRRVEYPRSTDTFVGDWYCDHYDDRNTTLATPFFWSKYFLSTLVSHLAFLLGQGGVHQRAGRPAELIPVTGIGLQRTAEIFHYALTQYFDNIPINKQGETLIDAANFLLDAAENLTESKRSCEYVMMRRALYALGLYPFDDSYNKTAYGGEACMLPWTYSWRFSQPYLGFPALWWQSPDLFINNTGSAAYDAIVGQENNLFARVRNIGDKDLSAVRVRFYFLSQGTNLPPSIANWHPCQNIAGVDCVLDIPTLAAGSMNFTDVNNPPTSQAVHWYLDPAYVTSEVDHFCLRAVIECDEPNHKNDCVNEVYSNVQYVKESEADQLRIAFEVNNWLPEPIPLNLKVTHTLPRGYRLQYVGNKPLKQIVLDKGKPQVVSFKLISPKRKPARLSPPYDGKIVVHAEGKVSGRLIGELSGVRMAPELPLKLSLKRNVKLTGMLSGAVETQEGKASLNGSFSGELDPITGKIYGEFQGSVAWGDGRYWTDVKVRVKGSLEPLRAAHFSQLVSGETVGGVTVDIKLPPLHR